MVPAASRVGVVCSVSFRSVYNRSPGTTERQQEGSGRGCTDPELDPSGDEALRVCGGIF